MLLAGLRYFTESSLCCFCRVNDFGIVTSIFVVHVEKTYWPIFECVRLWQSREENTSVNVFHICVINEMLNDLQLSQNLELFSLFQHHSYVNELVCVRWKIFKESIKFDDFQPLLHLFSRNSFFLFHPYHVTLDDTFWRQINLKLRLNFVDCLDWFWFVRIASISILSVLNFSNFINR